ncbi:hypothetical protein JCM5350_006118 [Sporobolomyces pararoseus]
MVSLRSATSPPASVRSSSRTNTPEPDNTTSRKPTRTYQGVNNRRKSTRLSQTSAPSDDPCPEKPLSNGTKTNRRSSVQSEAISENGSVSNGVSSTREDEAEVKARLGELETKAVNGVTEGVGIDVNATESPKSEDAEVSSVSSDQVQQSADALALLEAEKYRATSSKRRRSNQPVIDYTTDEEEELENGEEVEEEQEAKPVSKEKEKEEVAKKVEVQVQQQKKHTPAPTKKPSPPLSKAQPKKIAAKPPSTGAPASKTVDNQPASKPVTIQPKELPVKTSRPPVSSEPIPSLDATISSRKRKASPAIVKPVKRQKASTETQLKKNLAAAETPVELYSFQVIVFGDASASIKVQIPTRLQTPRYLLKPQYVSIYPFHVVRCITSDPSTPKSTYTAYRFPLPDRRHQAAFDKVKIKIYGKTVKAPSTRDGFVLTDAETGKAAWKLEADEDRCRWMRE